MKLHLPHKLRNALLACVSGLLAIGSTLGTGAVAGGAFVAAIAGLAMADGETGSESTEEDAHVGADMTANQWGNYVTNSDTLYDISTFTGVGTEASGGKVYLRGTTNVGFNTNGADVSVTVLGGYDYSSYYKEGEGTLTINGVLTEESQGAPQKTSVNGGTLKINYGNSSSGFVRETVSVAAGATLELAASDALGYAGGDYTDTLTLTGRAADAEAGTEALTANLVIDAHTTLSTNIELQGNTLVSGSGDLDAFGGKISASGTNNTISTTVLLRKGMEMNVATSGELTLTGDVKENSTYSDNGTLIKTGEGELIFDNTQTSATQELTTGMTLKKGSVVNKGTLSIVGLSLEDGSFTNEGTLTLGGELAMTSGSLLLKGGTVAFADGATLSLMGGSIASGLADGLSISVDTTLGSVTFGADGYTGSIALTGNVVVEDEVTNNIVLDLSSANVSVSSLALKELSYTKSSELTGDYTDGNNGFLSGTFTLVKNAEGASLSFGTGVEELTISVGGGTAALQTDGTFTYADTTGVYYVNESADYSANSMGAASAIYVASGKDLKIAEDATVGADILLDGGNINLNNMTLHVGNGSSEIRNLQLVSASSTTESKVYGGGALRTGVTGTGTLTLNATGQNTLYVYHSDSSTTLTIDNTGDVNITGGEVNLGWNGSVSVLNSGKLTVHSGATLNLNQSSTINNTGSLVVDGGSLTVGGGSSIGSNVTGITVQNGGTLTYTERSNYVNSSISQGVTLAGGTLAFVKSVENTNITLDGAGNVLKSTNSTSVHSGVTVGGTGNLTVLQAQSSADMWLWNSYSHTGALVLTNENSASTMLVRKGANLNNTGSLTLNQGAVKLESGATIGSNVTQMVIAGGALSVESGSTLSAKGIAMTSGSLTLGQSLTLTGGATDANSKAVDTLVLTGGTLAASTAVTLGYDATLGGVTIGDGTNTGAITIGAAANADSNEAGTQTTFSGTVTNNAALTLNGTLSLADGATFTTKTTAEGGSYSDGVNGFAGTSEYLVLGSTGSSLTMSSTTVGDKALTVAGGSAYIFTQGADTAYYVNSGEVAYGASGQSGATSYNLNKGTLNVGAKTWVSEALTVAANSTISGAAASSSTNSNERAGIIGGITLSGNGGDLTIQSSAGTVSNSSNHGDAFIIGGGDINLGSHDLIISEGVVRFGYGLNDNNAYDYGVATDDFAFTAGNVVVKSGSTLEIFRAGGTMNSGMTLDGGTLRVQQVNYKGTSSLDFGTLTVTSNGGEISRMAYGQEVTFSKLTGAGNLSVTEGGSTTIATAENYTGKLSQSGGTLNLNGGTLGGEVAVSGGTLNFAGSNIEGKTSVSGGTLNLKAGDVSGEVEVSGNGYFVVSNGATVSSTVKAGEMVTPNGSTEAQFVASATIAGKNDSNATFSGVTVEHNKIWGGTLKGAEVTVDNAFAIEGVTVQDCTFTINSALHMTKNSNTTTTMDSATVVDISSAGSLTNETSAALVLGSGSSLELNTGKAALVNNIDFNGRLMSATVITTSQLVGEFSGSITLEVLTSYLNTLGDAATNVLLVFDGLTMPSTQMAAYGLSTLSDEGTGSAASSVTLNGLTFTLDSALANYSFADQTKLTDKDYAGKTFVLLTTNSDGNPTTAIPEPTTATLSLLALAALCARRRRKAE